jgi:tRNA dimethylallyltransferase
MPELSPLPVLILFGPTASGKTEVLERLFSGPRSIADAEVVSADSMQVYRGMDIGTAKPRGQILEQLPHHLIDIRNPDEQFNVGDFVRLADRACVEISQRGRLPVVSGGTGFYLKNFVLGLPDAPPSDPTIRENLKMDLASRGAEALLEELSAIDSVSASRIHVNDTYRLLRALEVYRASGRPLSSFAPAGAAAQDQKKLGRPPYRFLILGIQRDRDELYRRINRRTAAMFDQGLDLEVAELVRRGYGPRDPGLRAIGYREFFIEEPNASDGGSPFHLAENLPAVQELVAQNSRRYAKRQITFFASIPQAQWVSFTGDGGAATEELRRIIEQHRMGPR